MCRKFCIVSTLLLFCGCWQSYENNNCMQSVIGTWKNIEEGEKWNFVFESDGIISEVLRPDGLHMILSEGGTNINPEPNLFIHYIYGPSEWSYDCRARFLQAKVVIEDFYIKSNEAELNCSIIDDFSGRVSEDGRSWTVSWKTITKWPDKQEQVSEVRRIIFHK